MFFFSSSSTAVTIGIIIAAAAVFAIHIDKNHEIKMNPNISLLGEDPIVFRVPRAILLKNFSRIREQFTKKWIDSVSKIKRN